MVFDGRLLGGVGVMAAVVETGNFARAGDALGLTQSGVSRAIARLEIRIGVRLFDRTPRAVTLTDEGRRFHQSVVPLLIGLEEAATDAAGSAAAVRGRLRINVDPFFARLVLALSCRWRSWDATVSATSWPTVLTPLYVSASRSPRRLSHGGSLRQGSLPAPRPPTWPSTAARRIPATSALDGTNAFTTWTPSPAGRFTGNFTAAGRDCGSRFLAAWQ
jgi:DNA-binding MarR family transcriptional regulator